ncbi:MAG: Bifunctional protein : Valine--tRNA ligase and putative adhesin [Bacteroidota bacterium]
MTIPAQFDAKTIEQKWYDYWMKNNIIIFIQNPTIERLIRL